MTKKETDEIIKIGITHGDINGIGYEVIIKTLVHANILELCTPIIYGSSKVASYYRKTLSMPEFNFNLIRNADTAIPKRINIINVTGKEAKIDMGQSTEIAGQFSLMALKAASDDLKNNNIQAMVTAPINKKNVQSAEFNFPGHTEYLANKFGVKDYLMLMISNKMRIGVVTGHIPLKNVASTLSTQLIIDKINKLHETLVKDFAINQPHIALLGLNPHSSDEGLIGEEEQNIIIPAIKKMKDEGMYVFGPYATDGFFGSSSYTHFDGILAMYHDQGMIPFKCMSFDSGVNYTAGLPVIRTSPAHGTAFDIAGKNLASPDSFEEALFLAIKIYKNRKDYAELTANPLKYTFHDEERPGSESKLVI